MEKPKKIKLIIGVSYVLLVGLFLFYLFSKFSFQELTSYDFIKENIEYFSQLKETNILIFLAFSINCYRNNKIFYLLFIYLITIKGQI